MAGYHLIIQEKLDELLALINNPKIKVGPRTLEVVRALKRLTNDANVVVVGAAIKALQGLANGAKKELAPAIKAVTFQNVLVG